VKTFLRFVLVAAFLLAQAAGIAHQAWHDAGAQAAHTGDSPKKNQLCGFHTALGNVLGALSSAHAPAAVEEQPDTKFVAAESSAARFSLLASRSRGPPALL